MAESLNRAIREAVTKEVRDALGLFIPRGGPMPCHVASEELVLASLTNRNAKVADVALSPEDFYVPLHRHLFAAFQLIGEKEPTETRIVAALKSLGVHGDPERLLEELLDIKIAPEIIGDDAVSDLQTHVELIREASLARQLIKWLRRLEEDLLLGRITAQEAKRKLRPHEAPDPSRVPNPPGHRRVDTETRLSPNAGGNRREARHDQDGGALPDAPAPRKGTSGAGR